MSRISLLIVGINESKVIETLLKKEDIHYSIICSNILDFKLPPKVKNAAPQWHRHELRNVLRQLAPEKFSISESLRNLLKENDRLDLSEENLAVTSHISQIEQNSKDLSVAYDLLLDQTEKENIDLIPLIDEVTPLLAFKNKKYAPLRYYYLKQNLLDVEPPQKEDGNKRKYKNSDLMVENLDILENVKLSKRTQDIMSDSDLILIFPTDLISLGVLVQADTLEKQIKKMETPLVLVWGFDNLEPSEIDNEIAQTLGFGSNLEGFAEDLSLITDYIIIPREEKEKIETLRKSGCHVLLSSFFDENDEISEELIENMFNVADVSVSETIEKKEEEQKEATTKEEEVTDENHTVGKQISQLVESPEEAGIEKVKEKISIDEENNGNKEDIQSLIKDIEDQEKMDDEDGESDNEGEDIVREKTDEGKTEEDKVEKEISKHENEPVDEEIFRTREEEDWIDTVKRAIEQCFDENNDEALEWLLKQSKNDSDKEVQIADLSVNAWIDSRSMPDRKQGAQIVSRLSKDHKETYLQILQRHMVSAVKEQQEDKRRILIPLFSILLEVDMDLTEQAVRAITKELALLSDDHEISVVELSKSTILQLVILSRRLTRVTIQELLNILDSRPNIGPEIWNTLTSFDAGSVALELVTNFSIAKAEEMIRRSNMLRFTGSYYSTITRVIQAWKEGDKAAISEATGTILPEETLRKFERLELARKLDKLKMVQLSTLAESLGKDVETVERLITELIVNDELHAEMKLIDEKMYLVSASETETEN